MLRARSLRIANVSTGSPVTVSPQSGTETGSGFAPVILQPQTVSPVAGSETGAGASPVISQPRALLPTSGQESGDGYAPALLHPQVLTAQSGNETGSGYAPVVRIGNGITVLPQRGSESGFGYAGFISQPRSILASKGRESGGGYAPVITQVAPSLLLEVLVIIKTQTQDVGQWQQKFEQIQTAQLLLPGDSADPFRAMYETVFNDSNFGAVSATVTNAVQNGETLTVGDTQYTIEQVVNIGRDVANVVIKQ